MAAIVRGLSKLPKISVIRNFSCTSSRLDVGKNVDLETHTGQVYDKDDYRQVRFMDKEKLEHYQSVQLFGFRSEPTILSVLISVQTVCKDYQRATKSSCVNTRFAINLVAEDPIVVCTKRSVWSSSGGALGHPKVYLNLDKQEGAVCGYSGRKFIQKKYYNETLHGPCITYEEYMKEEKS